MLDNQYLVRSNNHPDGYFHPNDHLLDGFTLKQLVDSLHAGSKIIDEDEVIAVTMSMVESQLEDMKSIIEANMSEIIDMAYDGREDNPTQEPTYDETWVDRAEALAKDIYNWCITNGIWQDVYIYYNGKRMGTSGKVDGKEVFRYNGKPFIEEGLNPKDYFNYVREPNILSMSFEGPLYELFNVTDFGNALESFNDMFEKYNLYYELGDAWNLSVYPIDG